MNFAKAWPFRYELVDGLRGVAALAVVMFHLGLMAGGHYAVMMFFVISGYCIAAAAESGRRKGFSFGAFMRRRLHRIYPPYLFAIAFFVLTRLAKLAFTGQNDLHRPLSDWIQNLTLTQWITLLFEPRAEAVQNPKLLVAAFWSLNYEEQFYLVIALALLLAVKRRVPMIAVIGALAAAGFLWNCVWPGGWVTGFFMEYWLHFALGAMLFFALSVYTGRIARGAFVSAVGALTVFCAIRIFPWHAETLLRERAFVELFVACVFTLALFFVRPLSAAISRQWLWKPVAAVGAISYSLYLVHQFNLAVVQKAAERMAPGAWQPLRPILMVALEIGIAVAFWYCCERPFLNRRSPPARPHVEEPAGLGEHVASAEGRPHVVGEQRA